MVKIVDKQNIFNSGIISTKLYSRDEMPQYNKGIADALNFVCSRHGPIEKRVGTKFIYNLANQESNIFLIPFIFSIKQSILIEICEGTEEGDSPVVMHFYTFDGTTFAPIMAPKENKTDPDEIYKVLMRIPDRSNRSSTSEIEDTTDSAPVYLNVGIDQIQDISYVQSLDVVYIALSGGNYPPLKLIRYENNDWKLEEFKTEDGPYLDTNFDVNKTMKIEGYNDAVSVITLSSNLHLGTADVGRWIRINTPRYNDQTYTYEDKWSYGKISSVSDDIIQSIAMKNVNYTYKNTKYTYELSKWTNGWQIYVGDLLTDNLFDTLYEEVKADVDQITFNSINAIYDQIIRAAILEKVNEALFGGSQIKSAGSKINVEWSYRNMIDNEIPTDTSKTTWMTKATSEWRLGVWHSGTNNDNYPVTYPSKVTLHQQRLVWSGITDKPWVWMSNSFAYTNYAPADYEGEITDANAISIDVSSDKVSEVFWMKSMKSLLIGTELGEIRVYSSGTALTPSDNVSTMQTSYGCHNALPIVTDDSIIFIQRLQRTLRSLMYNDSSDAYVGPELTILAENLTGVGLKKIVHQKEPNNTIWALCEDGSLLTLTYDQSQEVMGWSKSKLAGTKVKVIDLAVLPSVDYQQDVLFLVVERTINGVTVRYLEQLTKNFTDDLPQSEACYLDCASNVTDIHKDPNTKEEIYQEFVQVSGLDYLEGEEVAVTDEGAFAGKYTVENGTITLDYPMKNIWIGLTYPAYFETLERDFQDKQISTKMSKLRIHKIRLYLDKTVGVTIQRLQNGMETTLSYFNPSLNTDTTPSLLTGKHDIEVASAWDCDYRLRVTSDEGMPCTVSGIITGLEINAL